MPHNGSIRILLDLKDPNITFHENFYSERIIKGIPFGYRSFVHFKNRILITQGKLKLKAA